MSARKPVVKESSYLPCSEEVFWEAVKWAESSNNPKAAFHESFGTTVCPLHNKVGIDSLGLFQISYEDAKRYGCPFKVWQDTFDPDLNTKCKTLIRNRLDKLYPDLNYSQRYGKYWSVLRSYKDWAQWHKDNPNHRGFDNFVKFAKQFGCKL